MSLNISSASLSNDGYHIDRIALIVELADNLVQCSIFRFIERLFRQNGTDISDILRFEQQCAQNGRFEHHIVRHYANIGITMPDISAVLHCRCVFEVKFQRSSSASSFRGSPNYAPQHASLSFCCALSSNRWLYSS